MKINQKYVILTFAIFALAVLFAGAFFALSEVGAYAEQSRAPWNVDAEIEYGGDVFRYDLSVQIKGIEQEAQSRGFYLGYNGKKALANRLLASGLEKAAVYEYLLPNFTRITNRFSYVNRVRTDAEASFSSKGFSYSDSQDGVSIDVDKLFEQMISCRGRRTKISLPLTIDKATTVADVKKYTVKKSGFTTTFYNSSANRCHNISLAVKSIDGLTVHPNETFSFNAAVGERTERNGYKNAKVISNGAYTDGVGGGVCQVSTTLYNALLLAGFVPKASQHSLVSSYVMAGFDAMVADNAVDLTFVNDTNHNIYISGKTQGKTVTFTIYGEPNEYEIKRENTEEREPFKTKEIVDNVKYPELVYVDQTQVVVNGSDGVKSKSFLKYYKNGELVFTRLIRVNSYKRVDKVIARGALPRPQEPALNDGNVSTYEN